jgi:hypothetical protein
VALNVPVQVPIIFGAFCANTNAGRRAKIAITSLNFIYLTLWLGCEANIDLLLFNSNIIKLHILSGLKRK